MTWILRLYDDTSLEIGWVSVDDGGSYSFEITHQGSGWSGLKTRLSGWKTIYGGMGKDPGGRNFEITVYG
mgnify:CR=1 FL=1